MVAEIEKTPYGMASLKELMTSIVSQMLNEKQSEICIAIMSILNNLDAVQWRQIFENDLTNQVILPFLYSASR
jgi:hypothetical protein